MGLYINPEGMSKEAWLQHILALEVSEEEWTWKQRPEGLVPLCHIWNPSFTALLIAHHPREMEVALPVRGDDRPRRYYFAPIAAVAKELGEDMIQAIRADLDDGHIQATCEWHLTKEGR